MAKRKEANFAKIGNGAVIQDNVIIGLRYKKSCRPAIIGQTAKIRAGTIIYGDTKIGGNFETGHNVLVREQNVIGNNVLLGTAVVVEKACKIGNNVAAETGVYLPSYTTIEENVFLGPLACLTNDKYPLRVKGNLRGPIIRKQATIGANATILPGIEIGEGAFVAAGSVVTKNVPAWHLAIGVPAKFVPLPENLRVPNKNRRE